MDRSQKSRAPWRWIRKLLRVEPGEAGIVSAMLGYSILSVGGVVITGQLAGRALFLSRLPASAIPLKFILPPLVLVAVMALYTRFSDRWTRARLIQLTFVVAIVIVAVARLLLATPLRDSLALLLAVFVFFDILGNVVMIQFWTFAGDLFHPRQARRLFGIISGGSALSNIAFGAFLSELADTVRPEDLLFVVIGSLAGSMFIVGRLSGARLEPEPSSQRSSAVASAPATRGTLARDLREVLRSRLMVTIGAIVVVIALVSSVADFQLDLALKDTFGDDGQGMVRFLAVFRLWAGVVAAVLQFLVAGFLMERFGILPALLLLPGTIALGGLSILITGGALWAVAIPRAADISLKYTVNDSVFNLLYLPLSPTLRAKAKAVIDGVIKPPLVALMGVAFFVMGRFEGLSATTWAPLLLLLSALWVWLLFVASRRYVTTLGRSIALRRLDLGAEAIDLADETSIRVLAEALQHPDAMRVIHTLGLIREARTVDWTDRVAPLLEHDDANVRVMALRYLAESSATDQVEPIRQLMGKGDIDVRRAAIEAYCQLCGPRGVRQVIPCLASASDDGTDPDEELDPRLRDTAIVALIRFGGLEGVLHAGRQLHSLLESDDAQQRSQGARLLGELGVGGFYAPLLEMLEDDDRRVRLEAICASLTVRAPELVPGLLSNVDDASTQAETARALVACSREDPALLRELVMERGLPAPVRQQLVGALRQAGAVGGEVLVELIHELDDGVRGTAYATLCRLDAAERPELAKDHLRRKLGDELRVAYDRWLCWRDLRSNADEMPLLVEALAARVDGDRGRILALICLQHSDLSFGSLSKALDSTDSRLQANAVELIDNVVTTHRELLIPYLGGPDRRRAEAARRRLRLGSVSTVDRLRDLVEAPDSWVQACALHAIGLTGATQLTEQVQVALENDDSHVRYTAAYTLLQLGRLVAADGTGDRSGGAESDRDSTALIKEKSGMALAPLEKILFLKQIPMFRQIPAEEISGLLPIVGEAAFREGEEILRQGDEGDCLYNLIEGEVAVEIDGSRIDTVLRTRDVLGELAILTAEPRAATCVALSDVLALRIDRDPFWQLMRERPEVSIGVIRVLLKYLKK